MNKIIQINNSINDFLSDRISCNICSIGAYIRLPVVFVLICLKIRTPETLADVGGDGT